MKNNFLKSLLTTLFFIVLFSQGFSKNIFAAKFSKYQQINGFGILDTVPEFRMDYIEIGIPRDMSFYSTDSTHEVGNVATYSIEGMIPNKDENTLISPLKGNKNYEESETPYLLLCRLLKAYAKSDINAVKKLYVSDASKKFEAMLAGPNVKNQFVEFMKSILDFRLLLAYKTSQGLIVIVQVNMKGGKSMPMPFLTEKVKKEWYLKAGSENSPMFSNIMTYLLANKDPQKLIISSKPKK